MELHQKVKDILIPSGSTRQQAISSAIWSGTYNFSDKLLRIIKLVVVARLLPPRAFGLMGIALLILVGLQRISQLGLDIALVQREDSDIDSRLSTAWTIQVGRGILLGLILFTTAPFIAAFFDAPRSLVIIQSLSIVPVIDGFKNTGVIYLQKELNFHKRLVYKISSTLVNVTVSIGCALIFESVWALVFGSLAGKIAVLIASYLVHPFRPSINFDRNEAEELVNYGKWITLSGVIILIHSQGDDAFIGWYIGTSALGLYQVAYRLSNAPATEVAHVVADVALPTYSQLQSNQNKLRQGLYKTTQFTSLVSFPMGIGIILVAPVFVPLALGGNWTEMIPAMQVLAVWGMFRSIGSCNGVFFQSIGKPDLTAKLGLVQAILVAIFIYPLTATQGIVGTGLAVVLAIAIVQPFAMYLAVKEVNGSLIHFGKMLLYPAVASSWMGFAVIYTRMSISITPMILTLTIMVLVGMLSYGVGLLTLDRMTAFDLKDLVRTIVG